MRWCFSIVVMQFGFIFISAILCACQEDDVTLEGSGTFLSNAENYQIEGTLYLPSGTGPFPLVIIVPGSGNESRFVLEPFAELLNPVGFAVYTYDKRSIGGSSGTYPTETLENPADFLKSRAEDVVGIINLLRNHKSIDIDRIGLLGSSQGTWVNALIYEMLPNSYLSFMIMSSGGVVPTRMEHYYEQLILEQGMSIEEANASLSSYSGPLGFDAREIMSDVDIPVAFVLGGMDSSHPTLYEVDYLEEVAKPNFQLFFYPDADHELNDVNTGELSPDILVDMISWLTDNT